MKRDRSILHGRSFNQTYCSLQGFGGLEIRNPSEQAVTIQQSDLIPDYIDDVEDIVRHHSADGNVPLSRCRYWNRFGLLYVDELPMLGQAESKPNFSFKANDRNIISRSDTYRNFPSKLESSMSGEADDEIVNEKGDTYGWDAIGSSEPLETLLLVTCLVFKHDGILAHTGGAKTIKFDGALQGIPVSMMVDSGATRNFLFQSLVIALGLPVCAFDGIRIQLGNGQFSANKAYVSWKVSNVLIFIFGNVS
ncbi:hypothetical protein E3N88_07377 [Mikania micrantha]|uniref:Uncharacterized protein n=1 Tax=Mikania micrantha TaxID=192012 RepID=A0A5N6PS29_9ASTR|nr:hypothetical protein E3N88_07377 [Mikania micrantha]